MTKLLPCPFCSGKANIRNIAASVLFDCICEDCGATTKYEPARRQAATAWNRRAQSSGNPGELVETLTQVMIDTAQELGCEADNEAILQAIHDLKARVAELEGALSWAMKRIEKRGFVVIAIPPGWKLVPEIPTPEMVFHGSTYGKSKTSTIKTWKAMLSFAPEPDHIRDAAKTIDSQVLKHHETFDADMAEVRDVLRDTPKNPEVAG